MAPFLFLARRGRIFEHRGKPVDGLPVRPGDQVPVVIDGDLNGVVSSLLLDVGEGFPVPDEPRGVRVPQIMEPNRPEARLPETSKEMSFGGSPRGSRLLPPD